MTSEAWAKLEATLTNPDKEVSVLLYRVKDNMPQGIAVANTHLLDEALKVFWSIDQHNLPTYWLYQKRDQSWFQWTSDGSSLSKTGPGLRAEEWQVPKPVKVLHMLMV